MAKPFVTMVVLTYYKFDGIKDNLESLAKQDYTDFEVIIQDDGSPNFDRAYLEELAENSLGEIPWTVHQNEQNMGTVRSFNKAFEMAQGDYVFPLSQDDYFKDETAIRHIVEYMEAHPELGACTSRRVGETSGRMYPEEADIKLLEAWDTKELWKRVVYDNFISGSTIYYRKSFWEARGGFDTDFLLVEDYPFVVSMILDNQKIGFLDEITICYGEDGVSNGKPSEKILNDRQKLYDKFILSNMDGIDSKLMKSYVDYQYGYIAYRHDKKKYMLHNLRHIGVVLRILYAIHIKKLNFDERYYYFNK